MTLWKSTMNKEYYILPSVKGAERSQKYFPSVLPERQCSQPQIDPIRNRALDEELVSPWPIVGSISFHSSFINHSTQRYSKYSPTAPSRLHRILPITNSKRQSTVTVRKSWFSAAQVGRAKRSHHANAAYIAARRTWRSITGTLFSPHNLLLSSLENQFIARKPGTKG